MSLTETQFKWLRWLHDNGGIARLERNKVVCGERKSTNAAAISFLNLVAKGCLLPHEGRLFVTRYGKRCLGIPESQIHADDSGGAR